MPYDSFQDVYSKLMMDALEGEADRLQAMLYYPFRMVVKPKMA